MTPATHGHIDSNESDDEWTVDPYFSGPNAGDRGDRHTTTKPTIKSPAERAIFDPRDPDKGVFAG